MYEITTVTLVGNLSYVAIVGVDRESCILKGDMGGATTSEHTLMWIQSTSDHITIANLTFHNTHNWNSTYQHGRSLLIQSSDTYVHNCKFISNAKDALGIAGNSVDNVTIDTCYAEAYYFAMDMINDPSASGWSNILIKDSVFKITVDDPDDTHSIIYLPDTFSRISFQNCLFESEISNRTVIGGHLEGSASSTLYLY
ncbi:hypothetical protein J7M23_12860, partial [Candidatus Sumerlaeota bacterium]|nr:hypothetical protein [Candidatus Sumerlaeota bacterium]